MASLTTIEKMMLIRQVPIFAELDADDLEELARDRRGAASSTPNKDLFREGDAGDAVYLIVKGKVRVFVGGGDRPETTHQRARARARASARWPCSTRRRARRPCARSNARARCASPAKASSA